MKKDLQKFLSEYERQTNTHNFANVRPLIVPKAVYWFSNGNYEGIDAIERAFVATWKRIKDEMYHVSDVHWIVATDTVGVCTYDFEWSGKVNGKLKKGRGKGTNVIIKRGNKWQMMHEHLSTN